MAWMQRWLTQLDRRLQGIIAPVALNEQQVETGFNWQLPIYAAVGASGVLLFLFIYSQQGGLLYLFLIAPIGFLVCLVLFVVAAIRKRPRRSLSMLLTLVSFLAVSAALLKNEGALRPWLRWFLWSQRFKAEVLAQPTPANGELKHIEWDGWGGAPVGDWTAYVVFDPTDSLSAVARSSSHGKFMGIPCDVDQVRQLESGWYSVTLGMNQWWDRCD
jgi:hypothetical protein